MKKKLQILSLLVTFNLYSCVTTNNSTIIPISDINMDFPTSEKLELKFFNKYDIADPNSGCRIEDSILWYFGEDKNILGTCYNLNTGDKLSTIAMIGKASYEFTTSPNYEFVGDSIQFSTNFNNLKTFAKKDILENRPMGERKITITPYPDTINVSRAIKLSNGSVLATIRPGFSFDKGLNSEINKKSIVIYNGNVANYYETIKYDSFEIEQKDGSEDIGVAINDQIKLSYSNGSIVVKDNNIAAFSVHGQFMLYTFDIQSGNVVKEKRYTKMQSVGTETVNNMGLYTGNLISNDKYILCVVDGYFSEEDKKSSVRKYAIFVFDWDLNPIKRFDLPVKKGGYYTVSSDLKSAYLCKYDNDVFTLYKSDLNL